MTEHVLKSWPEFYSPIADGTRTFDLRKNDRNFKVGPPYHGLLRGYVILGLAAK